MFAKALALAGPFRLPPDGVAWAALVLATLLVLVAWRRPGILREGSPRAFVFVAATAAAFLSLGYAAYYLRGGPRIVDATTYYLQGRALSEGHFAFPVLEPSASFRGRFLLHTEPDGLAGIFPPGYPLLLAVGFFFGVPMLVGPLLAAAIVVATYALTKELAADATPENRELYARAAALLSLFNAALRYHTADTMSHGATALAVALALTWALRGVREHTVRPFALAGLAVGFVAATRLASVLPIGALALGLALRHERRARALGTLALASLPGLALLAVSQNAATGHALVATQRAYYAVSDGPPDCFRWGFGAGVGCLYEHGDFVAARLPQGYGVLEALGTTVRRLHLHLDDVLGGWPLMLFAVPVAVRGLTVRPMRAAALLVVLQMAAYAPFYFDGNYPGGGARFFADVLPVEHALLAVALAGTLRADYTRKALGLVGASIALFAVHGSFAHRALAERDGGAPMFEADRAKDAGADHGLLFVDTDHGFGLAFDPDKAASKKLVVARLRGDDHDRLLFQNLGRPTTFAYRYAGGAVTVQPFVPPDARDVFGKESWRFESEADWPPLAQDHGWAVPEWASGTCASNGQSLTLHPADPGTPAHATIALPVPRAGKWSVLPRAVLRGTGGHGKLRLRDAQGALLAEWGWTDDPANRALRCTELGTQKMSLPPGESQLELEASGAEIALDRTLLEPLDEPR